MIYFREKKGVGGGEGRGEAALVVGRIYLACSSTKNVLELFLMACVGIGSEGVQPVLRYRWRAYSQAPSLSERGDCVEILVECSNGNVAFVQFAGARAKRHPSSNLISPAISQNKGTKSVSLCPVAPISSPITALNSNGATDFCVDLRPDPGSSFDPCRCNRAFDRIVRWPCYTDKRRQDGIASCASTELPFLGGVEFSILFLTGFSALLPWNVWRGKGGREKKERQVLSLILFGICFIFNPPGPGPQVQEMSAPLTPVSLNPFSPPWSTVPRVSGETVETFPPVRALTRPLLFFFLRFRIVVAVSAKAAMLTRRERRTADGSFRTCRHEFTKQHFGIRFISSSLGRDLGGSQHRGLESRRGRSESECGPRGNPPTSDIVQHDSCTRKFGSDPALTSCGTVSWCATHLECGRLEVRIPGLDFWWFLSRILTCGNLAGRCRWSAGFLGALPFTPTLHSGAAPYSPRFTLTGSQELYHEFPEQWEVGRGGKKKKSRNQPSILGTPLWSSAAEDEDLDRGMTSVCEQECVRRSRSRSHLHTEIKTGAPLSRFLTPSPPPPRPTIFNPLFAHEESSAAKPQRAGRRRAVGGVGDKVYVVFHSPQIRGVQ
ncbi:hypothetical protein PR048_021224 [Dryococelus australis]|uniref:Uncharacterized protein n=1 Tax=Dryococelus australis TaxID=614101 RepID=A0ABQ9GXN6_9NEOP|nr:hypothetical protein PR048_021224 [Dryococelus australis]